MSKRKRLRITLKNGRVFEGWVFPKTDYSREDITILKLDSGYNIGIGSAEIDKTKELKTESSGKTPLPHIKGEGPPVAIVGTGGTIASRVDYITGGVESSMSVEEILSFVPEAADEAELEFIDLLNKLSEDMVPQNWVSIAKEVHKALKKNEGAIILHGTDTLHYTASALSFMLDLNKPVVLTGAQRSTDRPSTDAFLNLMCSIHAAKGPIPECQICFHANTSDDYNHIIRGNRARKLHTSARAAFKSVNYPPLAKVWPDGRIEAGDHRKAEEPQLREDLEERVALVKVYPGSDPAILEFYASEGYKGIVLEGTGFGHVPVDPDNGKSWLPTIEKLAGKMQFVISSQTIFGRTHKHVYTNLRKLSGLGVAFAGDMTAETAYTKLMWVLGNHDKGVKKLMEKNLKGEKGPRTLNV